MKIFATAQHLGPAPPRRVVEVGVGTGYAISIAERVFSSSELIGLDVDPNMLEKAKLREYQKTPRFDLADPVKLPLTDEYAAFTYACCAFHLFTDKKASAREMLRTTEKGGTIAIIGYAHQDLKSQIFHRAFPAFSTREIATHPSIGEIIDVFSALGVAPTQVQREEFTLTLSGADVFAILSERQFFGLRSMPEIEFEKGLAASREYLLRFEADSLIKSKSALTAIFFGV